ncbi:GNAT family N-acetyltransferase [soil metagenome]
MNWILYHNITEFEPAHLYEVLKLRQDIFIIEQNCIYDDIDGLDYDSAHLLLHGDDDTLIGYLRLVPAGKKFDELSLGRIAIKKEYRGKGYGKNLIKKGLAIAKKWGETSIRIEAQAHLVNYYANLGFKTNSETYDVDGIPHIQMMV